jgi:hypothetical protein
MKSLIVILSLLVFSCEGSLEDSKSTYQDKCELALEHIYECVGYKPYLKSCTLNDAEKILSTPCESIKDLWR